MRETGSSEPDPRTTGIPCINDIDLPFDGQRHWLTVQTSGMATVDEPEIWEDLEKLNLNGLKPAPTPIVTPKPIKNTEYVNTSYSKSNSMLGPRLWNVTFIYLCLVHRRTEQQQGSLEEVDDALLEALKDIKERSTGESSYTVGCSSMRLLSSTRISALACTHTLMPHFSSPSPAVIEFEDKVECFIKDASLDVLEFPHTQSTYHVRRQYLLRPLEVSRLHLHRSNLVLCW